CANPPSSNWNDGEEYFEFW
nr:immunoglobulin heavy chain junction region [Macaca mulatta]MPN70762.1 immunoglobulin heavy chain junction region [Macaca mulatta]MPN70971.1 immunoglobulin heavy chain junction region [Macaca mulatta]MPN72783.1 immunoglobulin heavy chain junction region [Macaca mulatta]MPN73044.1 immunoglobulin heavy chain junction region [Macaca mulatta]